MLIDGNSIMYRAFFAMPPLTNSTGLHTNAIYGFTTMLLKLLDEYKPTHVLVAFDAGKVNFRHESFVEYKAGRQKTPSELSEQFPVAKELISAFGIAQYEHSGYEADDIIGTLTKLADSQNIETVVVSGDKDMLQLASENVTIAVTRKGVSDVDLYTPEAIMEKYQLTPAQIIDLKGLMGDTSDNIPGVPGVGEKTAIKLLTQFPSVEEVLEHIDSQKGKLKENLQNNADSARLSKQLATIFREVPVEVTEDSIKYNGYTSTELVTMFQRLEFKSLIERLNMTVESGTSADEAAEAVAALNIVALTSETQTEQLTQLLTTLKLQSNHGLYIEAIGENPHIADFIAMSIACGDDVFVINKEALLSDSFAPLRSWLADETIVKYGFDLHKAKLVLGWLGIKLNGFLHDIQLVAYLLDQTDGTVLLHTIAERNGIYRLASDEQVYGKGAKLKLPEQEALYAHLATKANVIEHLITPLNEQLKEVGMEKLFYELEAPLASILADMEQLGIKVEEQELFNQGEEIKHKLDQLVEQIYELAGMPFNIGSPKQLGEVLFDKLGLPPKKKTKTGYSTDAEVLEELAPYHPIIPNILEYRQLAKLQSTYIDGLTKEIRKQTGKIHTYFRQTIAATGRLSSQFPNLQNIPIRMEEGRKIRKAFVPSEPGWTIVAADYSQIELRVLAHISKDEKLKEAFIHNMDIHTKTAMDVFGVTEAEVDSNMRRAAKAVNFGIVYGISDFGLSQNLGITRKDAAKFIDQYFSIFSGVKQYMADIVTEAKETGYVLTLLDRRRYVKDIKSSNFNLRSFAERIAMNTPIQGTAADIIKLAMVNMDKAIKEKKLESRMLLQVHDELVFEVPPHELELMKALVPAVMESAMKLDVPLRADVSIGETWYEAK